MGGDALPFPTQRLSPDRYHDVSERLLAVLSAHYTLTCIPAQRPGKDSYGDVDILVAQPYTDRPFDPVPQLGSRAVSRNGPVLSFEFEGHQADAISVDASLFEVARLFYSFGDVGMILGMMLTTASLKLGCKGLLLVRPGQGGQLHLSSDRSRILAWLGMSETDWLAGFHDEQAVFAWLCTCRWFHPSTFSSSTEHRRNARRALSTRPMFVNFVHYVDSHHPPTIVADKADRPTAEAMQADAVAFFGCEVAVAALDAAAAKRQALKQCWNGGLVAARTGLEGKQLGLFMMACRQLVTDDELLAMNASEVERFIDESFARQVNNGRSHGDVAKIESEESKVSESESASDRWLACR